MKEKKCSSCKNGDIDAPVQDTTPMSTVKDPDTGRIKLRGYLCDEHYSMYLDDGYIISQ